MNSLETTWFSLVYHMGGREPRSSLIITDQVGGVFGEHWELRGETSDLKSQG
jgi:hypothetical protein